MNPSPRTSRITRVALAIVVVAGLAVACGDDSDHPVSAEDLWARPTAPGAEAAAIYGELTNTGDEAVELMAGYVPACGRIELHVSEMVDGVMSMRPATADVAILEPGESLVMEPMGLHVMCLDLAEPLVEGESSNIEFTFAEYGVIQSTVSIEDR